MSMATILVVQSHHHKITFVAFSCQLQSYSLIQAGLMTIDMKRWPLHYSSARPLDPKRTLYRYTKTAHTWREEEATCPLASSCWTRKNLTLDKRTFLPLPRESRKLPGLGLSRVSTVVTMVTWSRSKMVHRDHRGIRPSSPFTPQHHGPQLTKQSYYSL